MKRLLSILLAAALLLGMIPIAGAAFTDADAISDHFQAAVDYAVEKNLISGFPDGTFKPQDTLTRAQAAKILCVALEGADKANVLTKADTGFTDVPASHWAAKYVAYCVDKGIVAGVGGGKFNPDGKLTAAAFAKMLLVAYGFAKPEELVGSDWAVAAQKAMIARQFQWNTDTIGDKPTTRENACQIACTLMVAAANEKIEPGAYKETTIPFTDPGKYRLLGRALQSEDGVILDWSGDGVEFTIDCKNAISLTMSVEKTLSSYLRCRVLVDGRPSRQIPFRKTGTPTELAYHAIPAGTHTIRVLKDTSISQSRDMLKSLTMTCKPDTMAPTAQKAGYLEIIGDSTTEGAGTIVTDTPKVTTNSDSAICTYGYLLAEELDMDYQILAKGSAGIVRQAGDPPSSYANLYRYQNYYRDQETKYEYTRKADLVCIKVSGNDNSVSKEEWKAAAKAFINTIRANHGADVPIVLFFYSKSGTHRADARELAAEDPLVYAAECPIKRGDGMGNHASAKTQKEYAEYLLGVIRPLLEKK